jgi:transglutaminase-like putative cysteine protease
VEFRTRPPPSSIDYYAPVAALGYQMLKVTFPLGAEVERMVAMMGSPHSEGSQKLTSGSCSVQSGAGSSALTPVEVDNPSKYPVYFLDHSHLPAEDVTMVGSWLLQPHTVRVDQAKLRTVTWEQLDDARQTQPFAFYSSHEVVVQSDDHEIADFAQQTLGAGCRLGTTPYDAARKLFQAVLAHTTYYYPQLGQTDLRPKTAKAMLEKGFGDCGGFSILLVALFRHLGFASRTACGCWAGLDNGHCWCEIYFPGHGWVVCDGSAGNNASETGEFAYYFGNIPDLNLRFATMRGNTFNVGDVETLWLEGPYEQVWGDVHEKSTDGHTMLVEDLHLGPVGAAHQVATASRAAERHSARTTSLSVRRARRLQTGSAPNRFRHPPGGPRVTQAWSQDVPIRRQNALAVVRSASGPVWPRSSTPAGWSVHKDPRRGEASSITLTTSRRRDCGATLYSVPGANSNSGGTRSAARFSCLQPLGADSSARRSRSSSLRGVTSPTNPWKETMCPSVRS